MPANLTPQYLEAEQRFKLAQTPPEKLVALQEMMAIIPKHKGTEKLRAELKKKLSALRKESSGKKSGARRDFFHVEREGARQLALVGAPNSGKSALLARLSNARTEVADYPFTTRAPIPGILVYEDVHLQLVDLPPVSAEHMEYWVPQIIRNADAVLWIVDLSDDAILDHMESTEQVLERAKTDLKERKTLIVGHKSDDAEAATRAQIVLEIYADNLPMIPFSSSSATSPEAEAFKKNIYEFLELVRVYTKVPGKKAERKDPFVLSRGSTVLDLAGSVHRDLAESFKFARLWGEGKIDGIMVARDFILDDGDIVELHAA